MNLTEEQGLATAAEGGLSGPAAPSADESRVIRAVQEYLAELEAGNAPDRQEFLGRHPEVADKLTVCLDGLEFLHNVSPQLSEPTLDAIPPFVPEGPRQLGDFRILREVGRGGMGVVYEAEQISLGRRVALKVLPFAAALDARQLQRFKNEAQAAAQLHHQHIVPVYGVGSERGVHYFVMQFVDGRTLADVIVELRERNSARASAPKTLDGEATTRALGALPTKRPSGEPAPFRMAAKLGFQAAEALEHAHEMGVIHRDIKPGNLLVDGRGSLWIADFGLAQIHGDAKLTMTGDLLGTLRYMSPEQALGKRVLLDHRTDVYSLGTTLYELLTLEPAFSGLDREALLAQIAFDEPRPLRQIDKQIPHELETIVQKAMAKSPEDRYATAQELGDDLRRFLEDQPIRARRPTLLQRARKWVHRHPGVVVTATVALAAAVVILAVSTGLILGQYNRAEQAKDDALTAAVSEKTAKESAETKEAETTAVLAFVENQIFAAARPEGEAGGRGRDVTLRQALEAALPIVDKSFADKPLIEARLRMTVGQSFWHLGEGQIAADQFRRARALYTEHLGAEHPDTLKSMHHLAASYEYVGRYTEALALYEEMLPLRKAILGAEHPDTLRSMNGLAITYQLLGRHAEAVKIHEETFALLRATLGPDHVDTLKSMNNLANVYEGLGRDDDALKLREETLALQKAKVGPKRPATLSSMMNLANSYATVGRPADALKLREETLALTKDQLGPTHSQTISCMGNLAHSYYAVGRHTDALKLREATLVLRKSRSGLDHPYTFRSMDNLATSYYAVGRYADALKLQEETLALRKAKLPADHPDTLSSMLGLANCYAASSRPADAVKLYEETLALATVKRGRDHPFTVEVMRAMARLRMDMHEHAAAEALLVEALALAAKRQAARPLESAGIQAQLGDCLLRQNQFGKAESILRACVTTREEKDADGWATYWSKSLLGAALAGQQKHAEAEPLLLAGYEGLSKREDRIGAPDRSVLGDARNRLVQLYDAWGKKDQADAWRQKLGQPGKANLPM
jgi:serine/threonine protein kinase